MRIRWLPEGLKFVTPEMLASHVVFIPDVARLPVEPNRLDTQAPVS